MLLKENSINIRIDIRSSLSFIVMAVVGSSTVIFLLTKINDATLEVERISNSDIYRSLSDETRTPTPTTTIPLR